METKVRTGFELKSSAPALFLFLRLPPGWPEGKAPEKGSCFPRIFSPKEFTNNPGLVQKAHIWGKGRFPNPGTCHQPLPEIGGGEASGGGSKLF